MDPRRNGSIRTDYDGCPPKDTLTDRPPAPFHRRGGTLMYVIFLITALGLIAATMAQMTMHSMTATGDQIKMEQTIYGAEAGVEASIAAIEDFLQRSEEVDNHVLVTYLQDKIPSLKVAKIQVTMTYDTSSLKSNRVYIRAKANQEECEYVHFVVVTWEQSSDGAFYISSIDHATVYGDDGTS
ncbi:pilus assembly PilX N-terminal domain-containing protein [Heliobacterium chlorum]|uniref:Pilus assembly PilX N-terminal domain-containing protein n=1 Tax=Heliobacterium chlorum TaxID=2698 RepID=A0ABR7T2Q9_HELCL|nr:pilus assembly PilX N-terminal domain-containing protein [Heliobacterium chlorum]MBC9784921.1 pilus assembly PilX N-terminal domain-containing protein [Heliobacterium chlorum]